jgi:hypothetical protein
VIVAEWLGGPNDGATVALPDDSQTIRTMRPRLPAFNWVKENDPIKEIELDIVTHQVVRWRGKWYVIW